MVEGVEETKGLGSKDIAAFDVVASAAVAFGTVFAAREGGVGGRSDVLVVIFDGARVVACVIPNVSSGLVVGDTGEGEAVT